MAGDPDPKQPARIVDREALRRARLRGDECAACRRPPANGHHVIEKASPYFGDDVEENVVLVCGSGTAGCHGALHGNPYIDRAGKRWDGETVRRAIGRTIAADRPDIIRYVLRKLGAVPGRDYLARHYHLDLEEPCKDSEPTTPSSLA